MNSNHTSDVGRFMVAVGAVLACSKTGHVLIIKRSNTLDFRPSEWEIPYGRIAQHETPEAGLKREFQEEIGYSSFEVQSLLRAWHMYRGEKIAENELIGMTFLCNCSSETKITLSSEHSEYKWVSTQEALQLIVNDGIKQDIQAYIRRKSKGDTC